MTGEPHLRGVCQNLSYNKNLSLVGSGNEKNNPPGLGGPKEKPSKGKWHTGP
ncbi:hypothetical protein [Alphaspiravirus yamagawaense]|uniref:Uncharacterized protein n=1 Tax=Alphaspiravirus yamagawaense TaxID=1157339 RepID=J7Q331_9VIRU|nr:hypothetical protein [Aeropyrum coil-shaped virus]CCG27863.1 hypothetical protein [Aeropyrum coil-shaped virus]